MLKYLFVEEKRFVVLVGGGGILSRQLISGLLVVVGLNDILAVDVVDVGHIVSP